MKKHELLTQDMLDLLGVEHEDIERQLNFLITSKDELSLFMDKFFDGQNILKNTMEFKRHKQELYSMSREEFVKLCESGEDKKKQALETLFQEPVLSDTHMDNMSRSILPYDVIYDKQKKHPYETMTNIVMDRCMKQKDYSDDFLVTL